MRGDCSGAPIVLFSRSVDGGISEYMHAQGNELARRGFSVVMLAPARFVAAHPHARYEARGVLAAVSDDVRSRVVRRALFALFTILNPFILAWHVVRLRPRFVLLDSMSELFAPLWAWPHLLLARAGYRYAATLHDPVRERALGPDWWHRWSLRAAYAPLSIALVHDCAAAQAAGVPPHIRLVEVPHGVFPIAHAEGQGALRTELGIPAEATVALSFGYIVDRKNLGLAIEALAQVPGLHLLIAGRRGSLQDRAPESYLAQAAALGVVSRCHLVERFIDDAELDRFFRAADFLLMTYTKAFVSQSGVLHVAANWDRPVLASGGSGPLIDTVRRYGLGEVVDPDSVEALVIGLRHMTARRKDPATDHAAWQAFRNAASWHRNVDLLLDAVEAA